MKLMFNGEELQPIPLIKTAMMPSLKPIGKMLNLAENVALAVKHPIKNEMGKDAILNINSGLFHHAFLMPFNR